ncbi:fungal-specific transcription factor domain-containing protein [Cristinia sonorae]|uniref:Fungal-specific transcription factor domain-containing protein n=1 Tax=Cristinia sonorae TaxID=1940300 RepID=A0A8K0UQ10_9AGAR|nr:fungal-specific transcription factor domain-containing protein [Cristinia sonorae]
MPDLPSSPRKTLSSTSQAAKSQTQKKPGAPKPKGAVRAKSGCYTCRIRRKKCDEQPNAEGACQTCVRLRLQCLGFGAKRPDWMRENNSVTELREKIKTFLASQGMIKGHSGSGPRSNDGEPQVLILVDNLHSNPSSPPTPTLSAGSNGDHRQMTSYVRDGSHYQPTLPPPDQQQYHPPPPPRLNGTSSSYPNTRIASSHQPQYVSSYGPHYHYSYPAEEDIVTSDVAYSLVTAQQMPVDIPMIPTEQRRFVDHYLRNVLPIQYILASKTITSSMLRLIQAYPTAREAACLLSALHIRSLRLPEDSLNQAVESTYRRLELSLVNVDRTDYTEGDAMAGLHVVSTFLFSGGRGRWDLFLDIAVKFVSSVLNNPKYYGPEDVLKHCSETTRFIIKTTMWFDVLASVTTQQVPRFLSVYRQLFGRSGAYIGEGATSPEISMLPVMGCENHIVLAIAEISDLACWKATRSRQMSLSVPQLVERGREIEKTYLSPDDSLYGPSSASSHPVSVDMEILQRRRLTNEIFRASARVYLHTVLSGENPACPEIVRGVADTIHALKQVPTDSPRIHRDVIRSVVFGICICGCLTDDRGQRNFLLKMLQSQQQESVGNVAEVQRLMETVWERRARNQNGGQTVNWRDVMRESTKELLLLV